MATDEKLVALLPGHGHGIEALHPDGKLQVRPAHKGDFPARPFGNLVNIPLVHLELRVHLVDPGHLEEHISLSNRRAQQLFQFSFDHDPGKRGLHLGAVDMEANHLEPSPGLFFQGKGDPHVRQGVLGARFFRLPCVAVLIGNGHGLLQEEFPDVEGEKGIHFVHQVAYLHMHLVNVAVERGRKKGHIIRFQHEGGFHPVAPLPENQKRQGCGHDKAQQFCKGVLHAEELAEPFPQRHGRSCPEPPVMAFEVREAPRRLVAQDPQAPHFVFGKGFAGTFAGHHPHRRIVYPDRNGDHVGRALFPAESLVLPHHGVVALGAGPQDFFVLVKGLLHGRLQTLDHVHLFFKPLHVADGLKTNIGALEPTQADPVTAVAGSQLIAQRHGSGQIALLGVEQDHQVERFGKMHHIAPGLPRHSARLVGGRNIGDQFETGGDFFKGKGRALFKIEYTDADPVLFLEHQTDPEHHPVASPMGFRPPVFPCGTPLRRGPGDVFHPVAQVLCFCTLDSLGRPDGEAFPGFFIRAADHEQAEGRAGQAHGAFQESRPECTGGPLESAHAFQGLDDPPHVSAIILLLVRHRLPLSPAQGALKTMNPETPGRTRPS